MVAVAAPGTFWGRPRPESTLDVTIPLPPRPEGDLEVQVQEFVGPETDRDMIVEGNAAGTGARITVTEHGVQLFVTISGRRSLIGGTPGRFRAIYRIFWGQPGPGSKTGWSPLYSDNDHLEMLDVGSNADGRLEVFGVSCRRIWHTAQTSVGGPFDPWSPLSAENTPEFSRSGKRGRAARGRSASPGRHASGTPGRRPPAAVGGRLVELYGNDHRCVAVRVAANADGRLELFGINQAERIWHTWQQTPGGGWDGAWSRSTPTRPPRDARCG